MKSQEPMRILVVSWSVPPNSGGSATVIANLCKQFTRDEMLVVGELSATPAVWRWQPEWPRVVSVCHSWWSGWRGRRFYGWSALLVQVPLLVWRIWRLAVRFKPTHILVVYPDWRFLLAGALVAKWTGRPLFLYFHNTFKENVKGYEQVIARILQPAVFRAAQHVFVMSEGMVDLFRKNYPGLRCSALVHAFSAPLPQGVDVPTPRSPPDFVFLGSVNDSCLDALQRMMRVIHNIPRARLKFLTGTPRSVLTRQGLLGERDSCDSVMDSELMQKLADADVVLLPHGFIGSYAPEEYQTIFPTKTIEYLICGRPILAHTPPDCFLTRFLREHECALVVDEANEQAILRGITLLQNDAALRRRLVQNALRAAQQFRVSVVVRTLREQLQTA
ncbi:MAG: hypothetical protein A2341_06410 [Deltaproteobacteria bacterium RIFOXYB12_FULL_58_9]|nr:MAG: hypothetical protein A2341_06410 [Deltaproteobacteria bacterium RIFOXYB12_FULL_58_9]